MVDILYTLAFIGERSYLRSVLFVLTLYTVTSVFLSVGLSLLVTKMGFPAQKSVKFTLVVLSAFFGSGLIAMFSKLYFTTSVSDTSTIPIYIGFLVFIVLFLFVSTRLLTRRPYSFSSFNIISVSFTSLIWLTLAGYSIWDGKENKLSASPASVALPAKDSPNFLLVVVDSLRADHLSLYGYEKPTSPNLETLAREGAIFLRAYAQSSWTLPSVASIMTSLYPSNHSTTYDWDKLPLEILTMAEALKKKGYVTAAFSANPFVSPEFGLGQGFDSFYHTSSPDAKSFLNFVTAVRVLRKITSRFASFRVVTDSAFHLFGLKEKRSNCELDQVLNREVSTWLSSKSDKPWFIYIHYMCPHHPYEPPNRKERLDWQMKVIKGGLPISEEVRSKLISAYDNTIIYADSLIGDLTEKLRQLKIYDQTFLTITSDHGDEFYEHQNWSHGWTLYNEVIHVPLIMRYPRLVKSNQVVKQPVMLVDIMPTFLAAATIQGIRHMQGKNLLASVRDHTNIQRAYSELIGVKGRGKTIIQALTQEDKKHIKTIDPKVEPVEKFELYNLQEDFQEQQNLWNVQQAEIRKKWETDLAAFAVKAKESKGERAQISEDTKRRLQALGYLQ